MQPSSTATQPLKIPLVGSGNVATHLARAFHQAGHQIVQVWSREFDHAEQLAEQVFAEPINKLELLYPDADVYILAVSDDALFDLALDLKLRESLVVHTSGSVPMGVLRPVSRKHGVLYAPQSFVRTMAMDYGKLPFCIEGATPEVYDRIEALARTVSPHVYAVDSTMRLWLHLASVIVNNFGNALNAMAQDMLEQRGIPFDILRPLVQVTAQKAIASVDTAKVSNRYDSLWHLQTGPAVRHDEKTIDRHRAMLKGDPRLLQLYELMTDIIKNPSTL